MGERGPKKTPSQLRLLRGETRPSQINYDQPVPPLVEPAMPDWFDDRHAAVWERECEQLRAMHMLHAADQDTLVVYVRAVLRHEDAARLVMSAGVVVRGADGQPVRNPAVMVEAQSGEAVRRLAREFGLTPSSRVEFTAGGGPTLLPAERLLSGG